MGLRQIAESDLKNILEDDTYGFGYSIVVTDPTGFTPPAFTGFSNDISQLIDPDTGQAVAGRMASVALRISSLIAAGLEIPISIPSSSAKPWLIAFNDINGHGFTFKVSESIPDRALGIVVCLLEFYKIDGGGSA